MKKTSAILLVAILGLAACETPAGGPPRSERYEISAERRTEIPVRMRDAVNQLRQNAGLGPLVLDPLLSKAAAAHSRDMVKQNRPWNFGSNGSSPLQRVAASGFAGRFVGEAISETYETDLETIAIWAQDRGARAVLLNPLATHMGVGFVQERTGKLWWTLVTGKGA